jgi:hypothetical protein
MDLNKEIDYTTTTIKNILNDYSNTKDADSILKNLIQNLKSYYAVIEFELDEIKKEEIQQIINDAETYVSSL